MLIGILLAMSGVERVVDGGIALRLEVEQRPVEEGELLDRAHALVADAGVGRAANDVQPEDERPALGRDDRQPGRFGDDRGVGPVAAQDRRQRTGPAVLLRDDALDDDVAGGSQAGAFERDQGEEVGGETGLHVAGAAPVESAVDDLGRERRVGPAGGVAGLDRVDVGVEDQTSARRPCLDAVRRRSAGRRRSRSGRRARRRAPVRPGSVPSDRPRVRPPPSAPRRSPWTAASSPVTLGVRTSSDKKSIRSSRSWSTAAQSRALRSVGTGLLPSDVGSAAFRQARRRRNLRR